MSAAPSPGQYVREFHETYGVPIRENVTPRAPEAQLRLDLMEEEYREYYEAASYHDFVQMVDGLADMVYIAYGTALTFGVDLDAVLAEVHRSNMSKLGEDGKPVLRSDGKVLKGPNYFEPDIKGVLGL